MPNSCVNYIEKSFIAWATGEWSTLKGATALLASITLNTLGSKACQEKPLAYNKHL
jgi:hypothetical protein